MWAGPTNAGRPRLRHKSIRGKRLASYSFPAFIFNFGFFQSGQLICRSEQAERNCPSSRDDRRAYKSWPDHYLRTKPVNRIAIHQSAAYGSVAVSSV